VAQNVVARLDAAGDRDGAAVVVGNELVRGPGARDGVVCDQPALVDLEELELRLIDRGAITVAVGQVGNDGAVVIGWPVGPLQLHRASGCDRGFQGTRLCILVADDVGVGVLGAIDIAIIELILGPRNDLGRVILVRVQVDKISAIVVAVDHGACHIAMAGHQGGRAEEKSSKFGNRHFVKRTALGWKRTTKGGLQSMKFAPQERERKRVLALEGKKNE
jgi:hypothetical protein